MQQFIGLQLGDVRQRFHHFRGVAWARFWLLGKKRQDQLVECFWNTRNVF